MRCCTTGCGPLLRIVTMVDAARIQGAVRHGEGVLAVS